DAMRDAFLGAAEAALAERLMLALEAGQAAGGDKRGKQSAAVLVYGTEDYAAVDLRVDEHPYPVAELRRVWGVFQAQTMPFRQAMPGRGQPPRAAADDVAAILLRPPAERPGAMPAPDLWTDVLGIDVPPQRHAELLAAFATISEEIRRLRGLD